ncbi:MAG: hypothetical protein NTW13_01785, partial [Candidatus Omnitrophica bacterium]|nr:hypothetical protein [Candidatus Omnitrophota bacterium]
MKKIIIVASHFPPSNLAAVHRARLFAMHLPKFGWEPIIVTVHHRFYEEELDWNLEKLLDPNLRVEKVKALPVKPFRLIGDIGIRAFLPMLFRILNIIKKEKIDFLYITIPSFYSALLGRIVYMASKTKYGIDYIDPWVHDFPGSNKILSKARFSKLISKILEPIAVRKASLITGIAPKYYLDVFKRNPRLKNFCLSLAMPYGGERTDFEAVTKLNLKPYLFEKTGKIDLVYAGAMLPKAHEPLRAICEAISDNRNLYTNVRFHFIGTGTWLGSENKYNIKPLAKKFGI